MEGRRERREGGREGGVDKRLKKKYAKRGVNWTGHYRVFTLLQRSRGRMVVGS